MLCAPHELCSVRRILFFYIKFESIECEELLISTSFAGLFVPSLKTLQHIHIQLYAQPGEDQFRTLVSELASMTGKNVVESIEISAAMWVDLDWLRGSEWRALDKVLTQSTSGWERLKLFSLHIKVGVNDEAGELFEVLYKLAETQLSGLTGSKDILFDLFVSAVE